jgi:23S rRNA U2552 (ribose-2'-O)-methylase RlmE/FtsJ
LHDKDREIKLIIGDIFETKTIYKIAQEIGRNKLDLVLSDLSPNTSGHRELGIFYFYFLRSCENYGFL